MRFLIIILLFSSCILYGQNSKEFLSNRFPFEIIDTSIITQRGLGEKLEILGSCDWKNRVGKKVDIFWLKTDRGNFFGHVYEYFMDCDNLRLIYWSSNAKGIHPIVDFMIEDLEDDSKFVSSVKKHLKHKKKYKKYLGVDFKPSKSGLFTLWTEFFSWR